MIAKTCIVALALGTSVSPSLAGSVSVQSADGSRLQLNCRSYAASTAVKDLATPLNQVLDTLRATLMNSDQTFSLQNTQISAREAARRLRIVYETAPSATPAGGLPVRAYIDLDLPAKEMFRASLVNRIAAGARVTPKQLQQDVVIPPGECQAGR